MRKGLLLLIVGLLLGSLGPAGSARAASGVVLLHLDGSTGTYTDRGGTRAVLGTRQYSSYGRAFNVRMPVLTPPRNSRLNAFPYGATGLTGNDTNGDRDYTDAGEVDPVRLMDAMRSDGVYNIALSPTLGRISNEAEIIRILDGARIRNIKLVIRATELTVTTSTVTTTSTGTTITRKSRREGLNEREFLNRSDSLTATDTGDLSAMAGSDVYTINTTATNRNLQRLKSIFTKRPDLLSVIHSWYSLDEPMQRNMALSELQKIYRAHKAVFPTIPVFICYNQSPGVPDYNRDGISDGLLGQPENPYGAGVADIVGVVTYTASVPNYNYGSIRYLYTHARRAVNKVNTSTPIWAVPQAHALVSRPTNVPRPHHLYRQVNDWFRAGPDTGLRGFDGLLWYSWHLSSGSVQDKNDLEDNPPNRQMAIRIGQRIRSGRMITHRLPYRAELYVPAAPRSTIRTPRPGHLGLTAGTIQLSISHPWAGNDGLRHVLLDTGASSTRNRLLLEKTGRNVLRLVVFDTRGVQKWTGTRVDTYNMPGSGNFSPGYSEITATWSNGQLKLYLDGVRGTLSGGSGTGVLSSGGADVFLGTTLTGTGGADSTFGYVTIRSAAMTTSEVSNWTMGRHLAYAPPKVVLSSPAYGAATTDRTPTLVWKGATGALRYQVRVSQNSNLSSPVRSVVLAKASYTTPTAMAGGKSYYWRVRAYDEYGSGSWSSLRRFTIR